MRVKVEDRKTQGKLIELANELGCSMPEALNYLVKRLEALEAQHGKGNKEKG